MRSADEATRPSAGRFRERGTDRGVQGRGRLTLSLSISATRPERCVISIALLATSARCFAKGGCGSSARCRRGARVGRWSPRCCLLVTYLAVRRGEQDRARQRASWACGSSPSSPTRSRRSSWTTSSRSSTSPSASASAAATEREADGGEQADSGDGCPVGEACLVSARRCDGARPDELGVP